MELHPGIAQNRYFRNGPGQHIGLRTILKIARRGHDQDRIRRENDRLDQLHMKRIAGDLVRRHAVAHGSLQIAKQPAEAAVWRAVHPHPVLHARGIFGDDEQFRRELHPRIQRATLRLQRVTPASACVAIAVRHFDAKRRQGSSPCREEALAKRIQRCAQPQTGEDPQQDQTGLQPAPAFGLQRTGTVNAPGGEPRLHLPFEELNEAPIRGRGRGRGQVSCRLKLHERDQPFGQFGMTFFQQVRQADDIQSAAPGVPPGQCRDQDRRRQHAKRGEAQFEACADRAVNPQGKELKKGRP